MSVLNKKHTLKHIIFVVVVIMVVLLLLSLPLNLPAKPPIIVQHNNSAQQGATSLNNESWEINTAKRRVDRARRDVESARQDLQNAYIPRSAFQSNSRYHNIQQAQSALYRAEIDYRTASNDLYLLQRIHESAKREDALESKRKFHRPMIEISEPLYQQHNDEDD